MKARGIPWKKVADKLLNLLFGICGLGVLWFLAQLFCFASFSIPSDSMEPTLLAGDAIWVEKWSYGARLFDVAEAVEGKQVKIRRLPGTGRVERNDVVVFNYPCPGKWRKIEMDVMQYYVKRCVALPGDTFRIVDGRYRVDGHDGALGCVEAQDRFGRMIEEQRLSDRATGVRAYPGDSLMGWTVKKLGPFYIPRRGDVLPMNRKHALLYGNMMEWEQKRPVRHEGQNVYLGDSLVTEYRFLKNYYFMAGDKADNSKDSRYWGLLPEEYIVGKAVRIWKSVDRRTDKVRWNRIFKKIE